MVKVLCYEKSLNIDVYKKIVKLIDSNWLKRGKYHISSYKKMCKNIHTTRSFPSDDIGSDTTFNISLKCKAKENSKCNIILFQVQCRQT